MAQGHLAETTALHEIHISNDNAHDSGIHTRYNLASHFDIFLSGHKD